MANKNMHFFSFILIKINKQMTNFNKKCDKFYPIKI